MSVEYDRVEASRTAKCKELFLVCASDSPESSADIVDVWKNGHYTRDDAEFERLHPRNHGRFVCKGVVSEKEEKEYLDAVKSKDFAKCAKMVALLAKKRMPNTVVVDAFGSPKVVYHGTGKFGHTSFDPKLSRGFTTSKSDLVEGVYLTDSIYTALSYTGNADGEPKVTELSSDMVSYRFDEPSDIDSAREYLEDVYGMKNGDDKWLSILENEKDEAKIISLAKSVFKEHSSDRKKFEDEFYKVTDGVYGVYVNIENPTIADAHGHEWRTVWKDGEDNLTLGNSKTTAEFANEAKESGRDGLVVKNVVDYGCPVKKYDPSTVYVLFTGSMIKSSDAVTYDDKGNPIPLSKRFDFNNADIRY